MLLPFDRLRPALADFLDVILDAFRREVCRYETDIRLIDTHAKSNRRHNHRVLFMQETGLTQLSLLPAQSSVIAKAINSFRCQKGANRLRFSSGARVNDTAFSGVLFFYEWLAAVLASLSADHSNSEIFSLQAHGMHIRFYEQFFADISRTNSVGSGCKGNSWNRRKTFF